HRGLDHPRPEVEQRVLEDRLDHGTDGVAAANVQSLEREPCGPWWGGRDEVAPELPDEERLVGGMLKAKAARVAPVEASALAEDDLHVRVVVALVVTEVDRSDVVLPVVAETRQRACLLTHVALRVARAVAEGEELHQLASVVLVRRVAAV